MSAVLDVPPKARITPEDMLRLPDGGKGFELIGGELEEMPVSALATFITRRISTSLGNFVEAATLGWVTGEGASYRCFPDDEDKVCRPDVAFHRLDRLTAEQLLTEGHLTVVPDLVVEVLSPHDRAYQVNAKRRDWLAAGAQMVWVVYPVEQTFQVYKVDGSVAEFGRTDTLAGDPVLPAFKIVLGDLFKLPAA